MLKNAALLTTAALTVALAAGCSDSTTAGTAPAATTAPAASGAATATPTSDPGDNGLRTTPAGNGGKATRTSDPGDGAKATPTSDPGDPNGSDPGDGGNWFNAAKPCPAGQAVEIQKLGFGDVTGDGVDDALLARACEPITSRWPSTVEVFDGTTGEKPRRLGVLLADVGEADFPYVTDLSAAGGVVTVKAHGVGDGGSQACPNLKLTYKYEYSGGTFTRTGRTVTKSSSCLSLD
ncbi:hypothetical protein [Actinoplanes utahensis]|uniref:Lipoprotein n=1 Tax=Actinoplanes utahensis TaxID=1869 RepID=A0A0A6UMR2_ACTUT|nr:hypothetical protein [Actinoplanes utahensis]KHD76711.1 hypothetical protein MB27_15610 [Actinoplanes utahensis]GIF33228.1 hypothetical protein Aut01nite_62140 [Actinoplanes utahensis]